MNQMLMGVVIILGIGSYYLYTENQTLAANNLKLEGAIATQEEAIAALQADGESTISGIDHIERGYENIVSLLSLSLIHI